MSRTIIFPYKMTSESSKLLRDKLGALRVYPDRAYRYRDGDLVINWGNSNIPNWDNSSVKWLNEPGAVKNASNKLKTFRILQEFGIPIPNYSSIRPHTTWGRTIVRHKLTGHRGDGIEILEPGDEIPEAPLYTEYITAKAEYRVHVFDGSVIDISKKVRIDLEDELGLDCDPTEEEMMIKSHQNGWTFARGGIRFSLELGKVAIRAVKALGLDFGAVDIIRGENNELYTLEVNTAIGLAETTLNSYSNAIMNYQIKNS